MREKGRISNVIEKNLWNVIKNLVGKFIFYVGKLVDFGIKLYKNYQIIKSLIFNILVDFLSSITPKKFFKEI